ncbi:MAG: PilZ domain-containing protein [Xanthobacteraceae bacterium]
MRATELGKRKNVRVDFRRPARIVVVPNGRSFHCNIVDISQGGVCVDVGDLIVQKFFVLIVSSRGHVRRACKLIWRRGALVGACFVTAKQIKEDGRSPASEDATFTADR